jgi:ParB family transcriptional regulator, chromosome partitioning protein
MTTRRLGKGLSALIPTPESEEREAGSADQLIEIEIALIRPNPYQPRLKFDAQAQLELKNSISEKGLIQPLTVRRVDSGYELIAGERRLRAAAEAGFNKVPAYVIRVETKEEMIELSLIENVQREKLNPIEEATAFQRLISECQLTQDEVARKIGKDRSTVTNTLRLLKLPAEIQESVENGKISVGHARTLLGVEDQRVQRALWQKVIKNDISVRILEKLVRELSQVKLRKPLTTEKKSAQLLKVEEELRNAFGTKVSIRSRKEGGSIEIEFDSAEDLNRILEIIDRLK